MRKGFIKTILLVLMVMIILACLIAIAKSQYYFNLSPQIKTYHQSELCYESEISPDVFCKWLPPVNSFFSGQDLHLILKNPDQTSPIKTIEAVFIQQFLTPFSFDIVLLSYKYTQNGIHYLFAYDKNRKCYVQKKLAKVGI